MLALWSGLGYYGRARNLHRCAQVVVAEHGGEFPGSSAALAELPGIGRSTAAAIAAFCFGERVAILDGNVKRVLARVLAFDGDLADARAERELWQLASALLPARDIEAYTQGLMDLGATVCLARAPLCLLCPVRDGAPRRVPGPQERYPVKSRRLVRGRRDNVWLELRRGDAVWLVEREPSGVWAGLWSLPEFDSIADLDAVTAGWPGSGATLPPFVHVLTHFDWHLQPLRWTLPARARRERWRRWSRAGRAGAGSRSTPRSRSDCRRRCGSASRPSSPRAPSVRRVPDAQQRIDDVEPGERVLERHQPLLGLERERQDLAPAIGDPAGVVEAVRLEEGRGVLRRERRDRVGQAADDVAVRRRRSDDRIVGDRRRRLGAPEAVGLADASRRS